MERGVSTPGLDLLIDPFLLTSCGSSFSLACLPSRVCLAFVLAKRGTCLIRLVRLGIGFQCPYDVRTILRHVLRQIALGGAHTPSKVKVFSILILAYRTC